MDLGIIAIPELPQLVRSAATAVARSVRKTGREIMLQGSGDWPNGWWSFLSKIAKAALK